MHQLRKLLYTTHIEKDKCNVLDDYDYFLTSEEFLSQYIPYLSSCLIMSYLPKN